VLELRHYLGIGLALAAETEHAIAKATQNATPSTRPTTAVSAQELGVSTQLPKLLSAIDGEKSSLEERFQAQVCVGWLHWVVGEYSLAMVRLPGTTDQEYPQFDSLDAITGWTKVCVIKSSYLKANCLVRNGQRAEALQAFNLSLPSASTLWTTMPSTKQQRYWTELYLTEYSMLQSRALEESPIALDDPNCLACFRCWSKYWDIRGAGIAGGYGFRGTVPRRRIWFEYYDVISEILKQDLPFPTGYTPLNDEASARSQLYAELKQVEAKYEALLLSETQFPRAEEERQEVEAFVELVIDNWTILNGGGWAEHDLGPNGKELLSRGVLDLLYRASTKTFHSTAILRHLYRVHLAVAEFDLAFRSLDSYLELVKKGKARVEKTGHPEQSLDDDATVMETISSGIASLCRYGDKGAAEKARTLASELEHWLEDLRQPQSPGEGMSPLREDGQESAIQPQVGLKTQALSWQTIGLAQAQWARVAFDASSRAEIQSKAIRCLQKSLSADFGRAADIRGIFALGVLLAEKRELSPAIELVKTALLAEKVNTREQELHNGPYWRERSLIPLWHLLSLLLSARQDYILASRACEGAFEQFKDPSVLFGNKHLNGAYRSEHLNEAEIMKEKHDDAGNGVVDDMDDYEKETILEVKMTQLAIVELLEGPKVAVNASLELLSLFSRLFGVPQIKVTRHAPATTAVPKSSAGTLRGIFGSRSERARTRHGTATTDVEKLPAVPSRPQTTQTVDGAPELAIQVSGDSANSRENPRPRKSVSMSRRSESGRRASLRKRESSGSRRRAVSSGGVSRPPTVVDSESYFTPFGESADNDFFSSFASKRFGLGARTSSHAESITSNGSVRPATVDLTGISVERLEAHPSLLPVIKFSEDHDKWRRSAVLIKVWLMIAGFYRRAGMLDDANGAVAEAMKLVQSLETIVAQDTTGSLSVKQAGWAQKKSVEELWGDVWSEVSQPCCQKTLDSFANIYLRRATCP